MRKKTSLTVLQNYVEFELNFKRLLGTSQHDNQHQKSNLRSARAFVNIIFLVMTKFALMTLS